MSRLGVRISPAASGFEEKQVDPLACYTKDSGLESRQDCIEPWLSWLKRPSDTRKISGSNPLGSIMGL